MRRTLLICLPLLLALLGLTAVFAALPPPNTLVYATFLGAELAEYGRDIAVDAAGSVYVTGETQSTIFPTPTQTLAPNHGIDVYVAKINADGSDLAYVLWFNALALNAEDYAYGIALGSDGSAYVTGETRSADFCQVFGDVPGFDKNYNGDGDAFVLKVKPDGSGLAYCTFIGGPEWDTGRDIVVDAAGNAYVAGSTWSNTGFPTTTLAFDVSHNGLRDAFLLKLDPTGTQVLYGTFLGGSAQDEAVALAINDLQQAFLTGWTFSNNFPTTTLAYDPDHNGSADIFVARLDAGGATLQYGTFLGSGGDDRVRDLALDPSGDVHLIGYTDSPAFPTTPYAFDTTHNGERDAIVARLSPDASSLVYSTFLGGTAVDEGSGIDITGGDVVLTGHTQSTDFPTTTTAFSTTLSGSSDAFVAQLSRDGSLLGYASYLGGQNEDEGLAISAGEAGHLFLAGTTRSPDFPVTPGSYDTTLNGDYDIFVTRFGVEAPTYTIHLPILLRKS